MILCQNASRAAFAVLAGVLALCLTLAPAQAERFQGRSYLITDGRKDQGQAAPLIIAMHGFLGTPRNMRKKTQFDTLARQHGFVVVYPKGKGRRWNDGRRARAQTDDAGYLRDFARALVAQGLAKPSRIYWAGHSNGGGMAMRMACAHPELVAGIAVVATKVPTEYPCTDGRPLPAIFFHGTADPIAPHDGRSADSRLGHTLSAEGSLGVWQKRNRCRPPDKAKTLDREDDGTSAKTYRYRRCAAPLMYVRIDGHGHDWPMPGRRATRLQGPASQEVNASTLIWRFFEKR